MFLYLNSAIEFKFFFFLKHEIMKLWVFSVLSSLCRSASAPPPMHTHSTLTNKQWWLFSLSLSLSLSLCPVGRSNFAFCGSEVRTRWGFKESWCMQSFVWGSWGLKMASAPGWVLLPSMCLSFKQNYDCQVLLTSFLCWHTSPSPSPLPLLNLCGRRSLNCHHVELFVCRFLHFPMYLSRRVNSCHSIRLWSITPVSSKICLWCLCGLYLCRD